MHFLEFSLCVFSVYVGSVRFQPPGFIIVRTGLLTEHEIFCLLILELFEWQEMISLTIMLQMSVLLEAQEVIKPAGLLL